MQCLLDVFCSTIKKNALFRWACQHRERLRLNDNPLLVLLRVGFGVLNCVFCAHKPLNVERDTTHTPKEPPRVIYFKPTSTAGTLHCSCKPKLAGVVTSCKHHANVSQCRTAAVGLPSQSFPGVRLLPTAAATDS